MNSDIDYNALVSSIISKMMYTCSKFLYTKQMKSADGGSPMHLKDHNISLNNMSRNQLL